MPTSHLPPPHMCLEIPREERSRLLGKRRQGHIHTARTVRCEGAQECQSARLVRGCDLQPGKQDALSDHVTPRSDARASGRLKMKVSAHGYLGHQHHHNIKHKQASSERHLRRFSCCRHALETGVEKNTRANRDWVKEAGEELSRHVPELDCCRCNNHRRAHAIFCTGPSRHYAFSKEARH